MDLPCRDESYFLSPEYVEHSDTMKMLAKLLAAADAEIGVNELDTSLFLMFVDLERLIRAFGVARKSLPAVIDYRRDGNVRQRIADEFRSRAKQSECVTVHVAGYIDYLASWLDH